MATIIVTSDVPGNVKPSYASSSLVGLTVRANGEETTKVLDANGNMVEAQFPTPGSAPGLSTDTSSTRDETFNDASIGPPIFNDGQTFSGHLTLKSPTANFQFSEIGQSIAIALRGGETDTIFGFLDNQRITVTRSPNNNFGDHNNVQFTMLGRNPKSVRSKTANFTPADIGKTITVNGVSDTIASYVSAQEILVTTNNWDADTNATITIHARPFSQSLDKWVAYVYLWAATQRYPFVENDVSIGGSLAPRGPGSPIATLQLVKNNFSVAVVMQAPPSNRTDLDQIWLFRTAQFGTSAEALLNAQAGNLFFVNAIDAPAGSGTVNYTDNNDVEGTDRIESDNFGVPTFRFVIYSDPYWWGWGNFPLSIQGTWATNGVIHLTDATKWYTGRNGQYVRLAGVTTGGIGNGGLWLFKWVDSTHAQLTNADGSNGTVPSSGSGTIVIQGPPTTLYRSKPRNPFSWGFTEILETGDIVPQLYAFKVGGGLGTAISNIPSSPLLILSTEYPAGLFTLDTRLAGTTSFEDSLRRISDFYSFTSHFAQFPTIKQYYITGTQLRQERLVLWGWDAKNYAIIETDGTEINVVSSNVSKTLRTISSNRSQQLIAHGTYDARNRINCFWLPSGTKVSQIDLLLMHHVPTDQWFVHDDQDVLCSAKFQDGDTNLFKIYIGTETGLLGETFAEGFYRNWIDAARSYGTLASATVNTITRGDGLQFYLDRDGYVGNWCLVTDQYGQNEQWARISAVSSTVLTFDYIVPAVGTNTTQFNPVPQAGWIFYVGLIECRALKYLNLDAPEVDKKLTEFWLTLTGLDTGKIINKDTTNPFASSAFVRYYRELATTAFSPLVNGQTAIELIQAMLDDGTPTEVWLSQFPPTERIKAFGFEIIDRGFTQFRMYNWTLKVE